MSNARHDSKFIKCPFFHAEEKQCIYCEGVSPDTSIHLVFISPRMKAEYRAIKCNKDYNSCKIFQLNDKKYDEHGNLIP
jgi:hypothetical protein